MYNWVDEIPLSRPKKNIARDFSDCVLVAEVIKHFLPNIIDLHNYCNAHSITQKSNNWTTLNNKVLKKERGGVGGGGGQRFWVENKKSLSLLISLFK